MTVKTISVIIPTLNAGKTIAKLLDSLNTQIIVPDRIIIIDSSSSDNTIEICQKYKNVEIYTINRKDFDHGATRNLSAQNTNTNYILYMTQDACPADNNYITNILKPFKNKKIAMVSGCQKPHKNARICEKLTRYFNYPEKSYIRDKSDIKHLGIKTFFASDVCAAYNRDIFNKLGGFEEPILINEDMMIAAKFIFNDYKVAYAADAQVIHSHNYSPWQQFSRNFDIGVSLKQYDHYFQNISVTGEGIKMVKYVFRQLFSKHQYLSIAHYFIECIFKLAGNKLGKNYKILPTYFIKICTMNKNYWKQKK